MAIFVQDYSRSGGLSVDLSTYGKGEGARTALIVNIRGGDEEQVYSASDLERLLRDWPEDLWPTSDVWAAEVEAGFHDVGIRRSDHRHLPEPVPTRLDPPDFHTLQWRTVVPRVFEGRIDWDEVVAVLPEGTVEESWYGHRLLSFPMCPWDLPPEEQTALWRPFQRAMIPQDEWHWHGLD